jgi:hypothetical protein
MKICICITCDTAWLLSTVTLYGYVSRDTPWLLSTFTLYGYVSHVIPVYFHCHHLSLLPLQYKSPARNTSVNCSFFQLVCGTIVQTLLIVLTDRTIKTFYKKTCLLTASQWRPSHCIISVTAQQ